ncbi:MAG: hypothetical protein ACPHN2_08910 [Sinimarinibacterium flocculans]|uniref:hypothetical protein n=1 Tax=Sinimarinibacterium flocculans TaxID=985250 RepID=UPI003C40675E
MTWADETTLRRLYVDERMDCVQIGRMFGKDPKTVWYHLRRFGIPTRPRGSDKRQQFPKGHVPWIKGRKMPAEFRQKIRATTVARGGVPYLRNGQHWLQGQPPNANGRWLGGVTPERQEFYRSTEWKAACATVWKRADAKCERCGLDHRTINRKQQKFHVHQIVSFAVKELRAEPTNLALLCAPYHRFVHSKANTAREFLNTEQKAAA